MRAVGLGVAAAWCALTITELSGQTSGGRDRFHDYDAPKPGSYSLPVITRASGGAVIENTGKSKDLAELTRGRITVLSFIYTRCADGRACPYASNTLGQLQLASAREPDLAKQMRLVSVSFDPGYDTPQRMSEYADAMRETDKGCEWRFASLKSDGLSAVLNAYGEPVDSRANSADPLGPLSHVLRVFLIDEQGRVRNIYSSATLDARLVMADVKTLLLEQAALSGTK